ncbi:MAG: 2Fe-2S iron-sulfur cluster binding domain-containing protein [Deltaproteobacteria bacterium]|nr:MAG: 2Fe-2S iron-sulfur cluster binding domain-containing protein [Deltaproteobacteria bacterium]
MPTFTINGISVDVPERTTVLEAAKTVGIEIPHYCYHPKLSIAGNCRMCLVEVEKFPKLQIACNTFVTDGMVVKSNTEKVRQAVTGVLEFLLINHPIDCPICDQAGECGLQIYYMKYGLHKSRYAFEDKVHKKKVQDIGGQIILDAERCILCSRCIRFLEEVTGTSELEFFQRGDHSEISLFPGRPLDNQYTGNLADICPVGALTSKDFRFKCRVWNLRGAKSICPGCANGCNVEAHFKENILYRLVPRQNDEVNQTWMCDPGRLEYKKANEGRLFTPAVREHGGLKAEAWEAALSAVSFRLWETVEKNGSESVAVIASPAFSNEELYLTRKLADEVLRTPNLGFSPRSSGNGISDDFLIKPDKNPNTQGAKLLGISEEKFEDIVRKISDGKVKALLVLGNEIADFSEEKTGELLAGVPFVVQIGTNEGSVFRAAHAILPSASFVERGGTFTNHAGRVQRFWMGFPPRGNARSGIEIITGLANRLGAGWKFAGEASVFRAIAQSEAPFAGMSYESLGEQGQMAGGKG